MKVSQLADELPRYEIVKTKITLPRERIAAAFQAVARHFSDAATDNRDGLRLDWPDKWLLVRASNTEPIVRAIAEAPTQAEADRLCREAQAAMSEA
jgi:phosphomannomutase